MTSSLLVASLQRDEESWARLAKEHRKAGENVAAKYAAEISDLLRFYRLHHEALREGRASTA